MTNNEMLNGDGMDDKDVNDLAHEVWAAAQLMPGEGIEDGVKRVVDILETHERH